MEKYENGLEGIYGPSYKSTQEYGEMCYIYADIYFSINWYPECHRYLKENMNSLLNFNTPIHPDFSKCFLLFAKLLIEMSWLDKADIMINNSLIQLMKI